MIPDAGHGEIGNTCDFEPAYFSPASEGALFCDKIK